MQLHLHDLQQNASDLRNQLQQLKKLQVGTRGGGPPPCPALAGRLQPRSAKIPPFLATFWQGSLPSQQPDPLPRPPPQLQNQETVKTMLRRTETEISVRVTDTMRKHEDPLQRQRSLVEEERLRYLNEEELITQQLK